MLSSDKCHVDLCYIHQLMDALFDSPYGIRYNQRLTTPNLRCIYKVDGQIAACLFLCSAGSLINKPLPQRRSY